MPALLSVVERDGKVYLGSRELAIDDLGINIRTARSVSKGCLLA